MPVVIKNIPYPTYAPISPTKVPIPTIINSNRQNPTAIPTSTVLTIRMHMLDVKTGNPIPNVGTKVTINGEGISKTVENQAEVSFSLASPGIYEVIANNPSGYSASELSCSDNQQCYSLPVSCGIKVVLAKMSIDTYCKYEKINQGSQSTTHSVSLNSIDPSSGAVGSSIALHGSGFGTSNGYVVFYNSSGQASGGAPVDSWADTEIKARVPTVAGNSTYQVGIESSDGSKSNKISFNIGAVQPYIDGIDESTTQSVRKIKIRGSGFGNSQGTVNIYSNYPTLAQGYTISSWSDTEINVDVSGTSNSYQEYTVGVTISGGPSSSLKYVSW